MENGPLKKRGIARLASGLDPFEIGGCWAVLALWKLRPSDSLESDSLDLGVLAGMSFVKIKENEPFEVAMKRFKKQCEKAGILTELRRREHFDKPSVRKKKKAAAARKRALKKLKRMAR